jgi:hypothetical protein
MPAHVLYLGPALLELGHDVAWQAVLAVEIDQAVIDLGALLDERLAQRAEVAHRREGQALLQWHLQQQASQSTCGR